MKAATIRRYGTAEAVMIEDLPMPTPAQGEVLVQVAAAGVTSADARLRANDAPFGFKGLMRLFTGVIRPRNPVFGMEFAGRVVAIGAGALGFTKGDRVFGVTGFKGGAHAQYLAIKVSDRLFLQPDSLTDAQAAGFFFGGLTAADFLIDKAALQPGERLLVNGATGAVGSAAMQIARHLGAKVTAVCSAENHLTARTLGAERVIDYRDGPLAGKWDVILDVVGNLAYPVAAPLMAPGGRLLPVTATLPQQLAYALRSRRGGHRISGGVIADGGPAMARLIALHAKEAYTPLIGDTLPFSDIRRAHMLAGSRHRRGNTVVLIAG